MLAPSLTTAFARPAPPPETLLSATLADAGVIFDDRFPSPGGT
jgi:hypothetical protein